MTRAGTRGAGTDASVPMDAARADGGSSDGGATDGGADASFDAGADATAPIDAAGDDAGSDAGLDAGITPALDPLLVTLPCGGSIVASGLGCDMTASADDTSVFVGSPGSPVPVVLRVRSIAELQPYDSTSGGTGPYRVGGVPRNSGWTVLRLQISDPAVTYHLNVASGFVNRCYALDYTIATSITAGATVTLHADDGDGRGWRNLNGSGTPLSVPEPVPVTQPYDGQFAYVTLEP